MSLQTDWAERQCFLSFDRRSPCGKRAFALYFIVSLLIPNVNHLNLFLLPILLFGSAQALNIPSLQTSLANLAPDNQRGAFMSINGMVLRIGQTLGPLVIGIGYSVGEINGVYYLSALVALLGLGVLFTMIGANITPYSK